jgi:hypothetical protein
MTPLIIRSSHLISSHYWVQNNKFFKMLELRVILDLCKFFTMVKMPKDVTLFKQVRKETSQKRKRVPKETVGV